MQNIFRDYLQAYNILQYLNQILPMILHFAELTKCVSLSVYSKGICYRCVVIHEKHENVLQYKESKQ